MLHLMQHCKFSFCSLLCLGALFVLVVKCSYAQINGDVGNSLTIYVDCSDGNNTVDCGLTLSTPCKSLQFVISERGQQVSSRSVVIKILSAECKENGVLRFDSTNNNVSSWSFNGRTEAPKSPTIVHFSMESFSSAISFSYMIWKNSSHPTSFSAHLCNITFQDCTFDDTKLQFTGLNTNLLIQNTLVRHCSSRGADIPLFFMQLFYNYAARLFIQNSTFSYNKSPIIYAMQFEEILIEDTLFLENGKDITSTMSMVKVSGSSVILRNSIVNRTLGPAIEVKNVKDFTSNKVVFLSNHGTAGSCLVVKNHSNVSLVDTAFKENTNPVISVKSNDGMNILLKACSFSSIQHSKDKNLPFLKASAGSNITVTNCSIPKSCPVHCNNGELVKSHLYCEKCPSGHFSFDPNNIILSDSCESCPAGTYTSSTGSTNCSLCGKGTYAQKTGNTGCKTCTNDFLTSDAGAASCSKMTLELILIIAATIPLIVIPLGLLLFGIFRTSGTKLKARLQNGKKYDRFGRDVTNNTGKKVKKLRLQDPEQSTAQWTDTMTN